MLRTNGRGVARRFAQGLPAQNSNGQFFSPDGRTLYSYGAHWPVAKWVNGTLHINDDRYSVTTSKHRSFMVGGMVTDGPPRALDNAVRHSNVREMRELP